MDKKRTWEFEESFKRPKNYFKLDGASQWEIDKRLGILDWDGGCSHNNSCCPICLKRFKAHYL